MATGDLRRRAQQAQEARATSSAQDDQPPIVVPEEDRPERLGRPIETAELPEPPDYSGNAITDAEPVKVHVAWARVMADVRYVAKKQTAKIDFEKKDGSKGSYTFPFRGIDAVLNATGPALRRHGVMIMPVHVETTYGMSGRMRDVQVTVQYEIWGPLGEKCIRAESAGEALDISERGTTKALTAAYRSMLIAALCLPTNDPKLDPDMQDLQREDTRPKPGDYVREITDRKHPPTLRRMQQIRRELDGTVYAGAIVENRVGDEVTLWDLVLEIGKERQEEERGG